MHLAVLVAFVQLRRNAKVDRLAPNLTAPRDSAAVARSEHIFKYQAKLYSPAGVAGHRSTTECTIVGDRAETLFHAAWVAMVVLLVTGI